MNKLQKQIIITTQPEDQAQKLSAFLSGNNLLLLAMPLIKTKTVALNQEIQHTLKNIEQFNIIIFTSKRGVDAFFSLVDKMNIEKYKLNKIKYAAIGKTTAAEVLKAGFPVDFLNKGTNSEDFAAYLIYEVIQPDDKILLPLGNLAPVFLQNELSKHAKTKRIDVYKTLKIKNPDREILKLIEQDNYNALIFTSPSAFENFIEITNYQAGEKHLKIISIGKTTTRFIENKGFNVDYTAKTASIEEIAKIIKNKLLMVNY